MAQNIQIAAKDQMVEQKITQQTTVSAGATGIISLTIPTNGKAFLKGYGYTWYTRNTYKLNAGTFSLPSRTDQEGSTSIPVIYGNPFPVNSGEQISLSITNGDSIDHTYDVVFYVITNRIIPTNSTGGELVLATGGASGTAPVATTVTLVNPSTLLNGSKTTTTDAATKLSATSVPCKTLSVQADPSNTAGALVGNGTSQTVVLLPGATTDIPVDDVSKCYIKNQTAGTNITVNYLGGV